LWFAPWPSESIWITRRTIFPVAQSSKIMSEKQIKKTKRNKMNQGKTSSSSSNAIEILATSTKQNLGGERKGADENRRRWRRVGWRRAAPVVAHHVVYIESCLGRVGYLLGDIGPS
jgi:hypothetical protein